MAKRVPFQINLFQLHKTWQCAWKTICILGKINEVVLHFERQRLVNMIFNKSRFFFLLKYLYRKFNFGGVGSPVLGACEKLISKLTFLK